MEEVRNGDGSGRGAPGKERPAEAGPAEIRVRFEWCKGCHYCVHVCPAGVFEADGHQVRVAHPDRCRSCQLCVWICPDFAIEVV